MKASCLFAWRWIASKELQINDKTLRNMGPMFRERRRTHLSDSAVVAKADVGPLDG